MKSPAKLHHKTALFSAVKSAFLLMLCLFVATFSYAQKNDRKGFILGIGVGPGLVSYKISISGFGFDFESEKENKVTFMSDFKIGYAPTNQLALYWTSKVAWFKSNIFFEDENLTINGMGGLGVSYFLENAAPSPYFNIGIGYSTLSSLNNENSGESINTFGLGLSAGAGYEFAKHWSAEANFTFGKPKDDDFTVNATAIRLTVNYLLY